MRRSIGTLYDRLLHKHFPETWKRRREAEEIREWNSKGRPARPPRAVKSLAIEEYRKRFRTRTLVESGTYLGDMVESCRRNFDRVISIELSAKLYEKAKA